MNNELYHYNHNHDKLGRFSSGPLGAVASVGKGAVQKLRKGIESGKNFIKKMNAKSKKYYETSMHKEYDRYLKSNKRTREFLRKFLKDNADVAVRDLSYEQYEAYQRGRTEGFAIGILADSKPRERVKPPSYNVHKRTSNGKRGSSK